MSAPMDSGGEVKLSARSWVTIESGFRGDVWLVIVDKPGRLLPICTVENDHPEAEEIARLIAAAPDLLAAAREGLLCAEADLENERQSCTENDEDPEADQFVKLFKARRDLIAAAIAKATGDA